MERIPVRTVFTVSLGVAAALATAPTTGVAGQDVQFVTEELGTDLFLLRGDPGGNVLGGSAMRAS